MPIRASYRGKRLLDIAVLTLGAPVWVPTILCTAVAVLVGMGRPVLFRQVRPGRGGHPFRMVKFRTMRDLYDADGRPLPDAQRLTKVGRFLRSTSLDELPALLNVLRGDLSLVGPRPLLMEYLPRYSDRHRRRLDVRPGITGLAQISGRNALSWPEKFELDVEYVEKGSLVLDLRILWRTATLVLARRGISAPGEATMPEFTGYGSPQG